MSFDRKNVAGNEDLIKRLFNKVILTNFLLFWMFHSIKVLTFYRSTVPFLVKKFFALLKLLSIWLRMPVKQNSVPHRLLKFPCLRLRIYFQRGDLYDIIFLKLHWNGNDEFCDEIEINSYSSWGSYSINYYACCFSTLDNHDLSIAEWEERISKWHLKLRNTSFIDAIVEYLDIAQDVELYGASIFEVETKNQVRQWISLDAVGLNIYESKK